MSDLVLRGRVGDDDYDDVVPSGTAARVGYQAGGSQYRGNYQSPSKVDRVVHALHDDPRVVVEPNGSLSVRNPIVAVGLALFIIAFVFLLYSLMKKH